MSLDITLYRVVTNGGETDKKHTMTKKEMEIVKKHFPSYVKEVGKQKDEWGNEYVAEIKAVAKAELGYTVFTKPDTTDKFLKGGLYLFKWKDVNRYYEEALTPDDHRTPVFKEQFLDRFKEGKDFIYFCY